jgi:hypothetical protein
MSGAGSRQGADSLRAQARMALRCLFFLCGTTAIGETLTGRCLERHEPRSLFFYCLDRICSRWSSIVSRTRSDQFRYPFFLSHGDLSGHKIDLRRKKRIWAANRSGQPRRRWNFNNQNRSENSRTDLKTREEQTDLKTASKELSTDQTITRRYSR